MCWTIMDDIDKKIIRTLQKDARTPMKHIAKECHVSRDTINNRYNSMVKDEVILGTTILLDSKKLVGGMFAFIGVKSNMSASEAIMKKIGDMMGICCISRAIGMYNIEGIFLGHSMQEISHAKEVIATIPDVIEVVVDVFVDSPLLCPQNFEMDER